MAALLVAQSALAEDYCVDRVGQMDCLSPELVKRFANTRALQQWFPTPQAQQTPAAYQAATLQLLDLALTDGIVVQARDPAQGQTLVHGARDLAATALYSAALQEQPALATPVWLALQQIADQDIAPVFSTRTFVPMIGGSDGLLAMVDILTLRVPGDNAIPIGSPSLVPLLPPVIPRPVTGCPWKTLNWQDGFVPDSDSCNLPKTFDMPAIALSAGVADNKAGWTGLGPIATVSGAANTLRDWGDSRPKVGLPPHASDLWRAQHDMVYISTDDDVAFVGLAADDTARSIEHCSGYLLPDRLTVLTAAHCFGLWRDQLPPLKIGVSVPCKGEALRFRLYPGLVGASLASTEMMTQRCASVKGLPGDLALVTLAGVMGQAEGWPKLGEIETAAVTPADIAATAAVYTLQFPHAAGLYEDREGSLQSLHKCAIAFAHAIHEEPSLSVANATRDFACVSADTVTGASGAPVFLVKGDQLKLIGVVSHAMTNTYADEVIALQTENGLIPQDCGDGLCNLISLLQRQP